MDPTPEQGAARVSGDAAEPASQAPGRQSPYLGLAFLALVLVALGLSAAVSGTSSGSPGDGAGAADADMGHPLLGDPDAPVLLVEFSDFRCPYCGLHADEVAPRIVADYVEQGIVRYEWRDLPFQGQESVNAALAARAAQEQGRFWEYHDRLFSGQADGFAIPTLRSIAADLDLDMGQFDDALESGRHEDLVRADVEEAQALGITATPTFYINGQMVGGAQPYEVFVEVIEAAHAAVDG